MTGSAMCCIRRPKYARDKRVEVGMRLYVENDADGFLVARKLAPRGGGNCVAVVLSEPDNGMGEVHLLQNDAHDGRRGSVRRSVRLSGS
jgi:hypothetical protein